MMRLRITLTLLITILATAAVRAGDETLTVTDQAGRTVTAPIDPDRIVCLSPGTLRLIVYLEAESKVAGVEDMEKMNPGGRPYWIAHPELAKLPRCGPGGPASINKKPDLEAVLAVNPQVIFVTYMDAALADETQRILNIPVVVLSYGEFGAFDETVYDALRIAGTILGREKRAEDVVNHIESLRVDLRRRTGDLPDDERPSVFVGGIGYRGSQGIESTEQNFIPFSWTNADNIAEQVEASIGSHVAMGKETLLKLDPDVIFVDGGGMSLVKQDVRKKPDYYNALSAFANNRVYSLLPFNWYMTNIGTALIDAYAIGKILYPARFQDVEPKTKADEIYSFLVGKPVYERMELTYGAIGEPISLLKAR